MKTNFKLSVKTLLFNAIFASLLISCRTAQVAVDSGLNTNTEVFDVKGRQGSQIGQTIYYGAYKTSKVKRGWTFSYRIPFIATFQGAKEKLSFSQFDSQGNSAEIAVVSRFRETEYEPIKDHFSVSLKYKNYFAGGVQLNQGSEFWEFIVHSVDGASRTLSQNPTAGFIRNGSTKIEITGIRELEGSSALLTRNDVYGYEFRRDGNILGAVSTINNGKVWFKKDLSTETKLVLASVSSALMLRNDVAEQAVSMK